MPTHDDDHSSRAPLPSSGNLAGAGTPGANAASAPLPPGWQELLDAFASHAAILDAEGRILAVNEAWREFGRRNGYAGTDFGVGENYLEISAQAHGEHCEEGPLVAAGIRDVLEGRRAQFSCTYPCHSPTEKRWYGLRATRILNHIHKGILVVHENISQVVISLLQRLEQQRSLDEAARTSSLQRFAEAMLNPLESALATGARTAAPPDRRQEARRQEAAPAPEHAVAAVADAAPPALPLVRVVAAAEEGGGSAGAGAPNSPDGGALDACVEELRLLSGRQSLQLGRVALGTLVCDWARREGAALLARAGATAVKPRLSVISTEGPGPEIRADAGAIGRMLGYLVENAAQATAAHARAGEGVGAGEGAPECGPGAEPAGRGARGEIFLRVGSVKLDLDELDGLALGVPLQPGIYATLTVSDAGVGIALEDLGRVFDPGFSRRAGARGMGLALAKSLAVSHGGAISLQSVAGCGTTATLLLPELGPGSDAGM